MNIDKYNNIYMELFSLTEEKLDSLKYQDIPEWDSVGHMSLIAEIEDVFQIEMEADDIVDFSSYQIGKEILKKYQVEL